MDKLVLETVSNISQDQIDKINSITGFVVLIVKIIEKAHSKKNLSYEESKRLVDLILDTLIISLEKRIISPKLDEILLFVKDNRSVVTELIDDTIYIWDIIVPNIKNCCGIFGRRKKHSRMEKSHTGLKRNDSSISRITTV